MKRGRWARTGLGTPSEARSVRVWCHELVTEFDPGTGSHLGLGRPWRQPVEQNDFLPGPPRGDPREEPMEVVYTHCAGLDVHKPTVVACRIIPGPTGELVKEVRTFSTVTRDLLALSDWLTEGGVTHVVMESTGVYWKPIWNLLEDAFTLLLVNAQHLKQVPG